MVVSWWIVVVLPCAKKHISSCTQATGTYTLQTLFAVLAAEATVYFILMNK